ncbi:hypothetical protein JCM10295v2_006357 [Rhodotorula toruloides]
MPHVAPSDGTASLIGVGIAVLANAMVSLALNVQRYVFLLVILAADFASQQRGFSPGTRSSSGPRTDKGFLKSKLWLLGFFVMVAGEVGNFIAYGFAPPSVVAPLGVVALIANVFLAPVIVREPFRKKDLIGVGIAIVGGATVVYASRQRDVKLTPSEFVAAISRPLFIIYAVSCAVSMSILAYFSRTKTGDRFVIVDLSFFKYSITYAVILTLALSAFLQLNYLQKSLQRFESRVVIPAQFTTFSLSTIVGSAILYRDFEGVGLPSLVNFVLGCLICAGGVYLLTRDSPDGPTTSMSPDSSADSLATDSAPASQRTPSFSSVSSQPLPRSTQALAIPDVRAGSSRRRRKLSVTLGGAYLLAASASDEGEEPRPLDEEQCL